MTRTAIRRLTRALLELVLLALFVTLSFTAPGFFTLDNLLNVLRNVSIQGLIALGMTLVIIAGEIDLSVGSGVAFSGCLAAWVVQRLLGGEHPASPPAAVAAGCAVAVASLTAVGAITGWIRVRFGVPTFISTLAWFTVLRGAAQLVTGGFPLTPFPDWFSFIGSGYLLGLPVPALLFLVTFLVVHFVCKHTPFGRAVYAVGGNAEAARLSGIRVGRVKVAVMSLVGLLAGVAGVVQASQIQSGSAATATGWELDVISAVIIGGTSLMGGAGSPWGTLVGLLFLGVLVNGMTLLDVSESWQNIVRGALILLAVLINLAPAAKRNAG